MTNPMNDTHDAPAPPQDQAVERTISRFKWVGWSSLFFAVVQSVCTLFVALSGLQLLLSAAAFSAAIAAMHVVDKIHADAIRIPMVIFALAGAVFNLVAVWQVRRLRGRASAAWRQKAISRGKFASEGAQLALSLLTLLLLAVESFYHLRNTHHL
jgi:hypothetical protein